jgi:hypothetical protein
LRVFWELLWGPFEIPFPTSTLVVKFSHSNAAKPNLILTGPVGGVINPGTGISKLLDQKK